MLKYRGRLPKPLKQKTHKSSNGILRAKSGTQILTYVYVRSGFPFRVSLLLSSLSDLCILIIINFHFGVNLNGKREIDKNDKIFANNNQGKHDLLMLMANSVDHYNLISGTMLSTLSYQGQKSESKYIFQVNVPEYQSYIYLVPSKNEESQVTFRDSERIYFFVGDLVIT